MKPFVFNTNEDFSATEYLSLNENLNISDPCIRITFDNRISTIVKTIVPWLFQC